MIYSPIGDSHSEVKFYEEYFNKGVIDGPSYRYSTVCENEMDVYVITFNNAFLVQYQIKTLRKFLKSPFNLIVVDNNNWLHEEQTRKVLRLCIDENVTYIKAPDNYYQRPESFDPTMKLGTTMNWLFVQSVLQRRPKYFGFLDHDCFLVRDLDMRPYLDKYGMYGKVIRGAVPESWTLHVTTNFYKTKFVGDRLLDFRASYQYGLDTGGANYNILYKGHSAERYAIEHHSVRFAEEDVNRKDSVQHYELIDNGNWCHMCASSHDQLAGDGAYKLIYFKGYLDGRLQQER